jgi:hypothetical protein
MQQMPAHMSQIGIGGSGGGGSTSMAGLNGGGSGSGAGATSNDPWARSANNWPRFPFEQVQQHQHRLPLQQQQPNFLSQQQSTLLHDEGLGGSSGNAQHGHLDAFGGGSGGPSQLSPFGQHANVHHQHGLGGAGSVTQQVASAGLRNNLFGAPGSGIPHGGH